MGSGQRISLLVTVRWAGRKPLISISEAAADLPPPDRFQTTEVSAASEYVATWLATVVEERRGGGAVHRPVDRPEPD